MILDNYCRGYGSLMQWILKRYWLSRKQFVYNVVFSFNTFCQWFTMSFCGLLNGKRSLSSVCLYGGISLYLMSAESFPLSEATTMWRSKTLRSRFRPRNHSLHLRLLLLLNHRLHLPKITSHLDALLTNTCNLLLIWLDEIMSRHLWCDNLWINWDRKPTTKFKRTKPWQTPKN